MAKLLLADKDIPGVGELMLASFPATSKFNVETSLFKWYSFF